VALGPNLLDAASSTFESGTGGDWTDGSYATHTVTSADAYSGSQSLRVDADSGTEYGIISIPFPAENGKRYLFYGHMRRAAGASGFQVGIIVPTRTSAWTIARDVWAPFSTLEFTSIADTTLYLNLYVQPDSVFSNQVYVDDLYLGEIPPGSYLPRPGTSYRAVGGWFGSNPSVLLPGSEGYVNNAVLPFTGQVVGATAIVTFSAGVGVPPTFVDGATSEVSFLATPGVPTVPTPVDVAGATAEFSLDTTPGAFTDNGPVVVVSGATALVVLVATAGAPSVAASLSVFGATAQVTLIGHVSGVTTSLGAPGDFRAAPIPITYLNLTSTNVQAFHPNLYTSTIESDEPAPGTLTATVWYSIWSNRPLTISVASSGAVSALDLFDPLFNQVPYSGAFNVQANTLYYIRAGAVTPSGVAEFILTATPVTSSATVDGGTVNYLPGTITVNGGGFPPNVPVTISMSGGAIATAMSDAAGSIVPTDVRLMAPLLAGTYSITGDAGSVHATGTLTVLNDPLPLAVTTPSDAAPSIPSGSHWRLQDPYTGTGVLPDFTFITNPSEMGSPHAPQNFLVDKTTAGVPHIWEGAARAYEWTFSGVLETQAEFDALSNYRKIGRRFFLRDHRNRIWTVTFTSLDVQPLRVYPALMSGMHVSEVLRHAPWAHKYTVQALIYSGPVMAS